MVENDVDVPEFWKLDSDDSSSTSSTTSTTSSTDYSSSESSDSELNDDEIELLESI